MSNSEKYELQDLENMTNAQIVTIAKKKFINATRKREVLIKEIANIIPRVYTKQKNKTQKNKTQKKQEVPQMHIQIKKSSSRSSKSSSTKQQTPSKSNSRERAYLNKDSVRAVISAIITDNKEYTFLTKIDFDYSEISKLLNINYKDEWRITSQKVIDYLESNNILHIAINLEHLNSFVYKLDRIVTKKSEIKNIDEYSDNIAHYISLVNTSIKSQPNHYIKIKEEYKKLINDYVDKFNTKKHVKDNDFTITNKLE